ncbi:methylthioribose kinase-like [Gigantopelta aegis]|uniref:methylthioribose kinase-like n=1 Tax=Gigantopelta aegis TaxID=1735272 RepID=UPI001B88A4D9|nr:methylthioribose kinase-like [Gigantopelta aegis]
MATQDGSDDIRTLILKSLEENSHIRELKFASDSSNVVLEEMEGGNLNYVWRAFSSSQPHNSVFVKQAPPFIKCLGEDYPLDSKRGHIEHEAGRMFISLAPNSVARPYYYDSKRDLVCMEYLDDFHVYRNELMSGLLDKDITKKIARDIAIIHRDTHVGKIGESALKQLDEKFENTSLISVTSQYIFTKPFIRDEPTNRYSDVIRGKLGWIYEDQEVLTAAEKMKEVFLNKKESLIHGDLHTGSLMVKESDSRMIDLEFTCVGPCAFDLGCLIANYIFSYYQHMMTPENNDEHRKVSYVLVDICHQTVAEYLKTMTSHVGDEDTYVANFMTEVAGFAGCEIIRRILGTAHVADLELPSAPGADVEALGAGIRLMKAYHRIHNIGMLMVIALMLS